MATGITRTGYDLQFETKAEIIEESDSFGLEIIDIIYRGANHFLQFTGKEYKAGAITPFFPWGALGVQGIIGRLGSAVAAAEVLTATTGTPAATAPATLTAAAAILAPNFPATLLFDSRLREVPIRLLILPTDVGAGVIKWFTTT